MAWPVPRAATKANLVARLRERAGANDPFDWHGAIEIEAAERIEELERELVKIIEEMA